MLDVKAKKSSLKWSFLIQIPVSPKRVKIIGLGWGAGVRVSDRPSGSSNMGGSTDYSVINAAVHDDL